MLKITFYVEDVPPEAQEPDQVEDDQRTHLYYAAARMFGWTAEQVDATDEHILRALLRVAHLGDEDDDGTSGQPTMPVKPDDGGPPIAVHVHGGALTERQLIDLVDERFLHHLDCDRRNPWGRNRV